MIGEGNKVVFIQGGKLCNGFIETVYPVIDTAIVSVGDELLKLKLSEIALAVEEPTLEETQEPEPEENEPVNEITITRNKFRDVSCRIIAESSKKSGAGIMFALLMGTIGAEIECALFGKPIVK